MITDFTKDKKSLFYIKQQKIVKKYIKKNITYSISLKDIEIIDKKIDFQKEYHKRYNTRVNQVTGEVTQGSIYSANHNSSKYFAEVNNRVHNLVNNSKSKGLEPCFLTLTAPSKYHKLDINNNLIFNPRDTSRELSKIFHKFMSIELFRNIKKDGFDIQYFRVYEAHKSGVPHLHCMLFLPPSYISKVKQKFYEYFTNKRWGNNKKSIDFKHTWYNDKGGAIAYMMKYILKTFKNEDSKKLQLQTYWFIKYRIIRLLTSRTLTPLSTYRKVRYYFKDKFKNDLSEIKKLIDNGQIYYIFRKLNKNGKPINSTAEQICFNFTDSTGLIHDIILWSKNAEQIIHNKDNSDGRFHMQFKAKEKTKYHQVMINNKLEYVYSNVLNKFVKYFKPIQKMTVRELYQNRNNSNLLQVTRDLIEKEIKER